MFFWFFLFFSLVTLWAGSVSKQPINDSALAPSEIEASTNLCCGAGEPPDPPPDTGDDDDE